MNQKLLENYSKEIATFEDWISSNPNLPQKMDRFLLLRFLKVCDFDLDKTQKLFLLNLKMRKNNPKLFHDRTLSSDDVQKLLERQQIFPIRKITKDNHKVSVFRILDPNPKDFDLCEFFKLFFMTLDGKFMNEDGEEVAHDGEVLINDMENFSSTFLLASLASPLVVKSVLKYAQEAAPMKLVQINFINCGSFFMKFVKFLKPFLKKEIADALHFHSSVETLFEIVEKECVPEEFGGTAGKCDELNREWIEVFLSKKDYLLEDDHWTVKD